MRWAVHFTIAPTWFDPADTPGLATPFKTLYALHDALTKPMPQGLITPSLAASWSESDDGLTYEFTLRRGLTFHNGDPCTAEDVKFSFQRYRGSGASVLRAKVHEVEVVDSHRVRFRLREPWPDFMTFYGTTATAAAWVVPKKYVEQVGDDGFKKHPIGLGPYKFVSFTPGVELVLEAYEGYWRKVPHVKRLVFKIVPEETTRLAMVKRGEVDIAYVFEGPLAEEVKRDPKLRVGSVRGHATFWIDFADKWNPASPWHDQRVRLAANLALDRQALNETLLLGIGLPTGSIIPHQFEYALRLEPYPYDPAAAKRLLAEAGYPNGFDAGEITPIAPWTNYAEAVAGYLAAVGIKVRVRIMERAAFLAAWREKKLQGLILGASGALGNAATRLESYVVTGGEFVYGGYPDLDELFRRQSVERDRKKREALLHDMQRLVHERAMFAPLFEFGRYDAIGPRVEEAGLGLIPLHAWSSPYEDLRLKR
jgi:peptide/nickel transport system substrate-binding protein